MAQGPLFCLVDQNLKDLIGHHFEYDRASVEGARAHGYEAVCLGHRDAIDTVREALPFRPAFTHSMWWLPDAPDRERAIAEANDSFLAELDAALADLPLDASSVVFAHMIVHGQLAAWARFVERRCGPSGPQLVLLLRYQPSFYQGSSCEVAFRSLERSVAAGARVRLASDSARLSGQLERLTRLPVETFPIPHTSEMHGGRVREPGPLRVVSLGNARDEKGILELFDAARILELRGDGGDLELILQVNHPNAEMAPAIERFAADPPHNVRLVRDALSTEAYAGLLASADIVATPYWRSIYEARTSGVFLEAVAAGKPVICTAETWMADELAKAGAGVITRDRDPAALACAIVEASDRFAELAAKARADRPKLRAFHNPERFIEVLLHGAPPVERVMERRVAVLFPWGDDLVEPSTGAARRVKPVIDLLASRVSAVRVLQDVDRPPRRIGTVSYEPDPLLKRSEGQDWFKLARKVLQKLGAKDGEELYALLHLAPARDAAFRARVEEMVAWADLILLEYPFWAEVVHAACEKHGKSFILTSHDVISNQCRSSRPLKAITRRLERRALGRADRRLALSRSDGAVFDRWGLPTESSPTGLDIDLQRTPIPGEARKLLNRLCGWPADDRAPLLLFMGSKFRPNVLAAEAIEAMARETDRDHPELRARFVVAGACRPPEDQGRFTALGLVDELTAHLLRRECALMLAPLTLGTGVSLKAYEAMANGVAMLSTTVGVRGIPGADTAAEIVDNLAAWPDRIAELLEDPARLSDLAARSAALGETMDYRRTYAVYLEAAGVGDARPVGPDPGDTARRALLLAAAEAAARHGLAETSDACLSAVLAFSPDDSAALVTRSRSAADGTTEGSERALSGLQDALRQGAEPVSVLRARAEILRSVGLDGVTEAFAQAARLRVSRSLVEGEGALRQDMWVAYNGGDRDWALALAGEVARHWPALADTRADYDYIYADLLKTAPESEVDMGEVERHARRALANGFDPFWANMVLAHVLGRRAAPPAEYTAVLDRALEAAAHDEGRSIAAVNALVEVGWRCLERGDLASARAAAQLAASKIRTGSALYLLGEIARLDAAPEDALGFYEQAETSGAHLGWCRTHQAELLLQRGENVRAAELALAALAAPDQPHRSDATRVVCEAIWRLYDGRPDDCAPLAERALKAGVDDGRVWYAQGELMMRRSAPDRALYAYDRALALGFDRYWGLRRRADAKSELGGDDVEDRVAAASATTNLDARRDVLAPLFAVDRPLAWQGEQGAALIALCSKGDSLRELVIAARQRMGEGGTAPPPDHILPIGKKVDEAWWVFGTGDYSRTLDLAERLIVSNRAALLRLAHAHYLAAECQQLLNQNLAGAVRHYDLALDFGFDPYWVHFNRAQLRLKLGDAKAAEEDLLAATQAAADPAQRQAARDSLERLREAALVA